MKDRVRFDTLLSINRMVIASDDLIWLLVKNNNKFLVKRNGNNTSSITFSSEPNNLYNLNTFKYSGRFCFPNSLVA